MGGSWKDPMEEKQEKFSLPTITTVIPTFQRPGLLRRAILSVLTQTYPNVCVCVYDNASEDDTKLVVEHMAKRDARVHYYRHSKNIGSYSNFNFGIRCVKTPFFSLLSDDDVLAPEFYENALKGFELFPDAGFVALGTMVIDEKGSVLSTPIPVNNEMYFSKGEGFEPMVKVSIPNTWTGILFRGKIVDQIGLINTDAGICADGGWVYHAAARMPFVVVPGLGAVLMAHSVSTSGMAPSLSGEWRAWWSAMIRDIEKDGLVSNIVKAKAKKMLEPNFRRIAAQQVSRKLEENSPEFAERAAEGLAQCGFPVSAFGLKFIIWIWSVIPGVRNVGIYFRQLYKIRLAAQRSEQTIQFEVQLSFLKKLETLTNAWEEKFVNSFKRNETIG